MKKTLVVLSLTLVVLAMIFVSCGPPPTPEPTPIPTVHPGKELVSNKCGTCHPVSVIEAKKLDQPGWQAIVDRMVSNGAQITAEQKPVIVDYLAIAYPNQ